VQPDETLALDVSLGGVLMQIQMLGAPPPLKIWEGKNVQKSVRFTTTFEFERKYLWNRWRYRHNLNGVYESYPFGVEQKKFVKFGSLRTKL